MSLLSSIFRRTLGLLCLSGPLFAQTTGSARSYSDDITALRTLVDVQRDAARRHSDRKAAFAKKRRLEFDSRVAEFTKSWNSLITARSKGTWSPKQAKAVRKAFERLLRTEGWVEDPN